MATINQLVSEIAHSLKQPDSLPVRRAIKLAIIHARNDVIRHNYENHGYTDKGLQQRFRVELINVPDGDLVGTSEIKLVQVKRSKYKVPRPVRLTNNTPFHSIRTSGSSNPTIIPFIREFVHQYYNYLPGFCPTVSYDYINDYLYINGVNDTDYEHLRYIIVESAFEYPHIINPKTSTDTDTGNDVINFNDADDDDEFLLSEDMIDDVKRLVLETWRPEVIRNTNEIYVPSKVS